MLSGAGKMMRDALGDARTAKLQILRNFYRPL
jgi:hypothetical protein